MPVYASEAIARVYEDWPPRSAGRKMLQALLKLGSRRNRLYLGELARLSKLSAKDAYKAASYLDSERIQLLEPGWTFRLPSGRERLLSCPQVYNALVAGTLDLEDTKYPDWLERTRPFFTPTKALRRLQRRH